MSDLNQLIPYLKFEPLDGEIFSTYAYEAAQLCTEKGNTNKINQIRRFYDELVMWNDRVQNATDPVKEFDKIKPFLFMLNAKVAYARGRGLVDESFFRLFKHTLSQVHSAETLKHCKLFYEAFVGFQKYLKPNSQRSS